MLTKLRLLLATLFVTGALAATAACSSGPTVYPAPGTWYVPYAGQQYCGYIYDPHEIDMYGSLTCSRVVFPPMGAVVVPGTLNYALMNYRMTYDSFYGSGYWYDQYYAPLGSRYHVTLVSRTSYLSYTRDFDSRYSSQIKSSSAKAKWSNGKTGNYTFPASNAKAANKPLTNSNTGTGSKLSNSGNSGASKYTGGNGSSGKSGSGGYSTSGKSGTTSNSGSFGGRRR